MNKDIATTNYIAGQRDYGLPNVYNPIKRVEVFNEKKNKWDNASFELRLYLCRKKLKTDRTIKIEYEKEED